MRRWASWAASLVSAPATAASLLPACASQATYPLHAAAKLPAGPATQASHTARAPDPTAWHSQGSQSSTRPLVPQPGPAARTGWHLDSIFYHGADELLLHHGVVLVQLEKPLLSSVAAAGSGSHCILLLLLLLPPPTPTPSNSSSPLRRHGTAESGSCARRYWMLEEKASRANPMLAAAWTRS